MKKIVTSHPTIISYVIGTIVGLLFVISVGAFWWQTRHYKATLMAQHLQQLAVIFRDIDTTAGIVSFEHQINYIDFLNVKKFKGSTLGSMNLRHPDRWRGPYVTKNPTIQEIYYQIVQTNQGYFITPGNGVKLPNGKTIGTDIDLTKLNVNIPLLSEDSEQLNINGIPLAISLADLTKITSKIEEGPSDPYDLL